MQQFRVRVCSCNTKPAIIYSFPIFLCVIVFPLCHCLVVISYCTTVGYRHVSLSSRLLFSSAIVNPFELQKNRGVLDFILFYFVTSSEWQPFGFGSNAKVTYTTRETYRRDQLLLNAAGQRRRRAVPESNLLLRVRATDASGVLFTARTSISACYLWVSRGAF